MELLKISKSYQKMFPRNCPVREYTGDRISVGTCTFYLTDGICPRHGDWKAEIDRQEQAKGAPE